MEREKIQKMISQMTLEEKVGMCSGSDFWHLKGVERLGIPSLMVTDGSHGLRRQAEAADHLGINKSEKAVCFPTGCAVASSFDRELIKRQGDRLGQECQAMDVSVVLGPAVNIKRSPLCGRNFEYYSEDPYVSTEMATAMIQGVQGRQVGTSVKHFVANNQEKRRMTNSSEVDERTLREIYLASFEGAVKHAKPWTVMSSYNKINGKFVGDDAGFLTDILRKEWNFDGCVISDWGAVNDRVKALRAGLDLEMPPGEFANDALILQEIQEGRLDVRVVEQTCERILNIIFRYMEHRDESAVFEYEKDHEVAAEIEAESMVLLKNEEMILPLKENKKIAFIGKYVANPRYQGGGSSHINSWKIESAKDAAEELQQKGELSNVRLVFATGFRDERDEVDEVLLNEAKKAAEASDIAVLFLGLPDNFESEGYDRKHMNLPDCQNTLVNEILKVQKNVVVVLHNGSPVLMPWKDHVKGILEVYLGGEGVGKATVDVLFGRKNPSGRLAETFPNRLEDTPCYLTYGKGKDYALYQEGIFVGYRYYTSKNIEVAFPFGHGLSYTSFAYCDLKADKEQMKDTDELRISVKVKNTGTMAGKEVVQLYVEPPVGEVIRPVRELRGFEKISLEPGEEKTVTFQLRERAFAYWNTQLHDWYVEEGEYRIKIGRNAQEMLLETAVRVYSTKVIPKKYSMNSCLGDLMRDPKAQGMLERLMNSMVPPEADEKAQTLQEGEDRGAVSDEMQAAMMDAMPLRQFLSFFPGVKREMLEQFIHTLNGQKTENNEKEI